MTDLVQRLETTLENAIAEKQNEEERIVSAYIKELEKCINAWDKNRDKHTPVGNEMKSTRFYSNSVIMFTITKI